MEMWAGFLQEVRRLTLSIMPRTTRNATTDVGNRTRGNRMGRTQAEPRDRPHGAPVRRRRARPVWRDERAGDRGRREGGATRHRLLPAYRQLPGEDFRRRQDPRRLFQA